MQGGLHPDFNIEWYEDLLTTLHAKYPKFQLHCFSPPEIHNISLISGLDYVTIMQRLKDAGLNSMPGGGGEILDDEVRATRLDQMQHAGMARCDACRPQGRPALDGDDDVRHRRQGRAPRPPSAAGPRRAGRDAADFTAFIPWTFQRENTALGRKITEEPTGIDYLKMLAVSRLFLDNVQHIQASWLTQGLKLGQTALRFGADDMGSIMIEENVVSAAGAYNEANERDLRYQIREAGFIPQQRDILYNYIDRDDIDDLDKANRCRSRN